MSLTDRHQTGDGSQYPREPSRSEESRVAGEFILQDSTSDPDPVQRVGIQYKASCCSTISQTEKFVDERERHSAKRLDSNTHGTVDTAPRRSLAALQTSFVPWGLFPRYCPSRPALNRDPAHTWFAHPVTQDYVSARNQMLVNRQRRFKYPPKRQKTSGVRQGRVRRQAVLRQPSNTFSLQEHPPRVCLFSKSSADRPFAIHAASAVSA